MRKDDGKHGCWQGDGQFTVTDGARVVQGWATTAVEVIELLGRADLPAAAIETALKAGDMTASVPFSREAMGAAMSLDQSEREFFRASVPQVLLGYLGSIRETIPRGAAELQAWITGRAADLNAREPQVREVQAFELGRLTDLTDTTDQPHIPGFAGLLDWIDPRLILRTSSDSVWNSIDRREDVVPAICASLRDADSPAAQLRWLAEFSIVSPVTVQLVPGPAGPVYELFQDGVHRTHAARILGLPAMMVEVRITGLPYPTSPIDKYPAPIGGRERIWNGLQRRNIVNATVIDDGFAIWDMRDVRAEWMLLDPECAIETNRAYERLYPGALSTYTGLDLDVLTDSRRWIEVLEAAPGRNPSSTAPRYKQWWARLARRCP